MNHMKIGIICCGKTIKKILGAVKTLGTGQELFENLIGNGGNLTWVVGLGLILFLSLLLT